MTSFCKPCRLDRCSNGSGLLLYVREDIPSRLLTEYKPPENVECLFVNIEPHVQTEKRSRGLSKT